MMTHHKIIIGDSRNMIEVADESVHLVITSPPYWQLKDYGNGSQIGFGDIIPKDGTGLFLVFMQTSIGIFMALLILARFISLIPKPKTLDEFEKR